MNTRDQTAADFYEAYKAAARRLGIFSRYESTENLLKHYKHLAHRCFEDGYSDVLDEYKNDLAVRGNIEAILHASELQFFEPFRQFQTAVREIDEMLQASFIPEVPTPIDGPWWQRGIVRKGHGDYAEDVKLSYGIDLATFQ